MSGFSRPSRQRSVSGNPDPILILTRIKTGKKNITYEVHLQIKTCEARGRIFDQCQNYCLPLHQNNQFKNTKFLHLAYME
jgi:hypothetical protein